MNLQDLCLQGLMLLNTSRGSLGSEAYLIEEPWYLVPQQHIPSLGGTVNEFSQK